MTKFLLIVIGFMILTLISSEWSKISCHQSWADSRYSIWSGCLVNVEGKYVPEQNVRVIKWIEE